MTSASPLRAEACWWQLSARRFGQGGLRPTDTHLRGSPSPSLRALAPATIRAAPPRSLQRHRHAEGKERNADTSAEATAAETAARASRARLAAPLVPLRAFHPAPPRVVPSVRHPSLGDIYRGDLRPRRRPRPPRPQEAGERDCEGARPGPQIRPAAVCESRARLWERARGLAHGGRTGAGRVSLRGVSPVAPLLSERMCKRRLLSSFAGRSPALRRVEWLAGGAGVQPRSAAACGSRGASAGGASPAVRGRAVRASSARAMSVSVSGLGMSTPGPTASTRSIQWAAPWRSTTHTTRWFVGKATDAPGAHRAPKRA